MKGKQMEQSQLHEIVIRLCQKDAGAMRVLMSLLIAHETEVILKMDTIGLTGFRIWEVYHNEHDEDLFSFCQFIHSQNKLDEYP